MRVYADTLAFAGVFDDEFATPGRAFVGGELNRVEERTR